jgi:hypothetical protein
MDRRPLSADPLHQARTIVFGLLACSLIERPRARVPDRKLRRADMLLFVGLGIWIGLALGTAFWLLTQ